MKSAAGTTQLMEDTDHVDKLPDFARMGACAVLSTSSTESRWISRGGKWFGVMSIDRNKAMCQFDGFGIASVCRHMRVDEDQGPR
jgi:hypothetical protein